MRRPSKLTSFASAIALTLAIGAGSTAMAEQQQFADETIESFAMAAMQIQEINMSAQEDLQAAESPEEQEQVQEEATELMIQAIEAEGLTVDEYNEIATAAQADQELASRIEEHAVEAQ